MRKLIAVLAACVGAMGLHAATTGTSFEGLIPEGAESTNYVDVLDVAAAELSGTPGQYWNVNAGNVDTLVDEFIVTTNYGEYTAYSGARNSSLSGNTSKSYLTIATKKGEEVTRYAQTSHEAVAIANNGSYYFDSLVQFTPFETNKFASEVLGGDGKMAIWLQAGDINPETLDPTTTNLIVSAGYLASDGAGGYVATPTNYVCKIVGSNPPNIFDGGWHRVTVKAFDSIYTGYNVPAFAIAIDGIAVEITNDISSAGIDSSLLTTRAVGYYDNNQKLFPSTKVGDKTVASTSFQGVGSVDDLVFSDVTDVSWMQDDAFTIELGANVTSAVYSVNGGASVEITADAEISYVENMVVTISNIGYADGYMKLGCGPADTGVAITTNAASYEVTVSAANKTVTIDAQAIGATIDGVPYPTLSGAFDAISGGTVTPPAPGDSIVVTLARSVSENVVLDNVDASVILDLAGNTITGVAGSDAAINLNAGSLTITNTTVTIGVVDAGASDTPAAFWANGGSITIADGIYDGVVYVVDAEDVLISGGKFNAAAIASMGDDSTYLDPLADNVLAGYALGLDGDYYVVADVTTTYSVTYNLDLAGATNAVDNIATFTVETPAFTLLDAGCDGYTFNGWTNEAGTVTTIAGGAIGDVTLYASWTAAGGGLDPESGVTNVTVTAASAAAAVTEAKAGISVPDGSGAVQSEYAEYFKYGVENISGDTYEVSITGIVETIEVGVAASAVQRLTDDEATAIDIPAGLYYRITPSDDLPISGTPTKGLSTGSVIIDKPGTDKGFYKVELNSTPLN